jgi:hypothetical protein
MKTATISMELKKRERASDERKVVSDWKVVLVQNHETEITRV